jgi:hypothetical protein
MAVSDFTPIGARFGKLAVIGASIRNKYGIACVPVRCNCGTEKQVNCADLRDGKSVSCGCGKKEIGKRRIERSRAEGSYFGIAVGQRFGRLVFIRAIDQDRNGKVRGEFACDCGSTASKSISIVASGHTSSCGCGSTWSNAVKPVIGEKWGRLTVIEDGGRGHRGQAMVVAECSCGSRGQYSLTALRRGSTKSCGCLKADGSTAYATHGHTRKGKPTPTYLTYWNMLARCTNPKSDHWHSYGGRGIEVCERWLKSFENFLSDMGECPPGLTLDRKEVNGNYEVSNCRWATDDEQANNKRTSHFVEFNGERLTVSQWAERLGIKVNALYARLNTRKWPIEKALTTPPRSSYQR